MHPNLQFISGVRLPGRERTVLDARNERLLVIQNPHPAGIETPSWIAGGSMAAMAAVAFVASLDALGVVILFLVLPASAGLLKAEITTAVDLSGGMIRRRWSIGLLACNSVYPIGESAAVFMKDVSRLMEGYCLPYYTVHIVGSGRSIMIYSTDDAEDADSICKEISGLLGNAGISTERPQSG